MMEGMMEGRMEERKEGRKEGRKEIFYTTTHIYNCVALRTW